MPGQYEMLDSDEHRLPDGVQRTGYDADTQTYSYRDNDGSYWEGEPGARYGQLHRPGEAPQPFDVRTKNFAQREWEDWRYMAPFFLLVVAFLLLVWKFFGPSITMKCGDGLKSYTISQGDTCWKIAESVPTTVDDLKRINPRLDCDRLTPGKRMCIP